MNRHKLLIEVEGKDSLSPMLSGLGTGVTGLGNIVGTAGLAVAGLGLALLGVAAAAVAATNAIIDFVRDSIAQAMEFEDAMKILEFAIIGLDVPLSTIHDVVIKVGKDTKLFGVDASEAADAVTILAKAGLKTGTIFGDLEGYMDDTAEAGGILRNVIDLAAASELNLNRATEFGIVLMSTFGGELETEAEKLALVAAGLDHTVRTADASVASVKDLTNAYRSVGPIMAGFGFTLEETNTLLAMLSDRGIKGASAGTALKSMFTNILRPTAAVQEALTEYNIALFDSHGNMLSAIQIIENLEKATAGLSEEERIRLVQTLAGSYGQKAAFTLLDEGTAGYAAMTQAIADATSMQEKAQSRTETLTGQMEIFDGVMQTLKISVGEHFLKAGHQVIGMLTGLVEKHGPKVIEWAGLAAEWLGDFLPKAITFLEAGLGIIFKGLSAISNIWTTALEPALLGLGEAIGLNTRKMGAAANTTNIFGAILKVIEFTVGAVVTGVQLLTIAVDVARQAVEWIRGVFEGLKGVLWGVVEALQWMRDWVDAVARSLGDLLIPDWLIPGSPAPLETALLGIGKAFAKMPEFQINATGVMNGGNGAGAMGGGITITNNFGPGSVRSDQDVLDIADAISTSLEIRGVRRAL